MDGANRCPQLRVTGREGDGRTAPCPSQQRDRAVALMNGGGSKIGPELQGCGPAQDPREDRMVGSALNR